MKNVVILGAGGHAKVIAEIIIRSGDNVVGFLDDNLDIQDKIVYMDKKVIGTVDDYKKFNDCFFIIGIGNNKVRKNISIKYKLKWYTAVHPNAVISSGVEIGEGSVIMAGTIINPGTVIGNHCIINTSSSVDHDNIIENYVHISPGAHLAGTVMIKELTWIGVGAVIKNNITIEKDNIIGAGAVVIKDIKDIGKIFVGVPAKER